MFGPNTHAFNGSVSGTTRVSRYQKGRTNLDFTEARDSEWQWHQLGRMQVCTSLQTDNYASTPPLSFLQAGCPSCRPTNSVKAKYDYKKIDYPTKASVASCVRTTALGTVCPSSTASSVPLSTSHRLHEVPGPPTTMWRPSTDNDTATCAAVAPKSYSSTSHWHLYVA